MKRLFLFRSQQNIANKTGEWLFVFCSDDAFPFDDFWDELSDDIGVNLQPDGIAFIIRETAAANIVPSLRGAVLKPTDWRVAIHRTSIKVITFDEAGEFCEHHHLWPQPELKKQSDWPKLFSVLKTSGVREIFVRRHGLVKAHESSHFVNPSGKHSRIFIRAANLMLYGPEVRFIAISLLKYISAKTAYIWIDTSALAALAYAAVDLKRQSTNTDFKSPTINSFSSWDAFKAGTNFPLKERTLFLISASTSGNLARKLIEDEKLARQNVVTIFSLAAKNTDLALVCDLTTESRLPIEAKELLHEYKDGDCAFCNSGSRIVRLVGDHFLADDISYGAEVPTVKDPPETLSDFMESYAGHGAFALRVGQDSIAVNSLYLNADTLVETGAFQEKFATACHRFVPASLAAIVYLPDKASQLLAERVLELHGESRTAKLISGSQIKNEQPNSINGAVVVVAGCIGVGGSLEAVSIDLRTVAPNAPKIFIVGFAKHAHLARNANLESNLTHTGEQHKHSLVILERMMLPRIDSLSAWQSEFKFLNNFLEPFGDEAAPDNIRDELENRKKRIESLAEGDSKELFWHDSKGALLELRQTFAFWNFEYKSKSISQGDVFFTIASILENMRTGKVPRLQQSAFYQSLLSPYTFGRFNDGIIQACFLRAAHRSELDYSGDDEQSSRMGRILGRIMREANNPVGEACAEFLMAIITGRLKVRPKDLEFLKRPHEHLSPILQFLRNATVSRIFRASDEKLLPHL